MTRSGIFRIARPSAASCTASWALTQGSSSRLPSLPPTHLSTRPSPRLQAPLQKAQLCFASFGHFLQRPESFGYLEGGKLHVNVYTCPQQLVLLCRMERNSMTAACKQQRGKIIKAPGFIRCWKGETDSHCAAISRSLLTS